MNEVFYKQEAPASSKQPVFYDKESLEAGKRKSRSCDQSVSMRAKIPRTVTRMNSDMAGSLMFLLLCFRTSCRVKELYYSITLQNRFFENCFLRLLSHKNVPI